MGTDQEQPEKVGKPNYGNAPMLGQILVRMFGADGSLCKWTRREFGFSKEGATRVVSCIVMRHAWFILSYTIGPLILFSLWFVLTPKFGGLGFIFFAIAPPLALAFAIYWFALRAMCSKIRDHLITPKCIYCGFDLSGTAHTGDTAVCTECGSTTPIVLDQ